MNYSPGPGQNCEAGDIDPGAHRPTPPLVFPLAHKVLVLCGFLIKLVQEKS